MKIDLNKPNKKGFGFFAQFTFRPKMLIKLFKKIFV